ncbi:UNVERIFIED_CONTAM: hypothetical protein NCL1_20521 [Trichonephila clavipes]
MALIGLLHPVFMLML